jgi:hypothetical protein
MNKNIKRLIEQAGETEVVNVVDIGDGYMETQVVKEFDREWFAELIVRQCIFEMMHESTLQDNTKIQDFSVAVANRVEKHFGIDK